MHTVHLMIGILINSTRRKQHSNNNSHLSLTIPSMLIYNPIHRVLPHQTSSILIMVPHRQQQRVIIQLMHHHRRLIHFIRNHHLLTTSHHFLHHRQWSRATISLTTSSRFGFRQTRRNSNTNINLEEPTWLSSTVMMVKQREWMITI